MLKHIKRFSLWIPLVLALGLAGCAGGARAAARIHGYTVDKHGTICAPAQLVDGVCQPQRHGRLP